MKIAVLRVRGVRNVAPRIRKTLELLRLERPNHCVLVEDTPQNMGMLAKVKDYVAYGPVSGETVFSLLRKRGRKDGGLIREKLKDDELKDAAANISKGSKTLDYANPVFRLNPPSGGFRDKKKIFPGGELGRRGEMDTLLRKMM